MSGRGGWGEVSNSESECSSLRAGGGLGNQVMMRAKRRRTGGGGPRRVEALEARTLLALAVNIDYSLDTTHFFDAPERRAVLRQTLEDIAGRLDDRLAAVPATDYTFTDPPRHGVTKYTRPVAVPADTLTIFAYAAPFTSNSYGVAQGSSAVRYYKDAIFRGQAPGDYAPDVGRLEFNQNYEASWSFTERLSRHDQIDFATVARHLFLQSLGWDASFGFGQKVAGNVFVGAAAESANGGQPVPLDLDGSHLQSDVGSIMGPSIQRGQRQFLGGAGVRRPGRHRLVDRPGRAGGADAAGLSRPRPVSRRRRRHRDAGGLPRPGRVPRPDRRPARRPDRRHHVRRPRAGAAGGEDRRGPLRRQGDARGPRRGTGQAGPELHV